MDDFRVNLKLEVSEEAQSSTKISKKLQDNIDAAEKQKKYVTSMVEQLQGQINDMQSEAEDATNAAKRELEQ